MLHTKLCDILEIEYPVILAGMGSVASAELVAAVSNAGGLGVLGATRFTPDGLREEIRKIKILTNKPFGVDLLLPVNLPAEGSTESLVAEIPAEHVAYVEKLQRDFNMPPAEIKRRQPLTGSVVREQVKVILEERTPVFASGLGNPGWMIPDARAVGTKIIGLVGNVKNARRVADSGVDIVVAQGYDAGGHTGRIGTLALVPQAVDAISPVPVVAAGGIGDGRGLVAALALGAVGVWCGTIFIPTIEANAHANWKKRIVEMTEEDTRISKCFSGKTQRAIYNKWVEAWETAPVAPLPMPYQGILVDPVMAAMRETGNTDYMQMPTGQIGGMVKELKSAKQVVDEMVAQARQILSEKLPAEVLVSRK